jgi:diacylglycerol kinase family enzyme
MKKIFLVLNPVAGSRAADDVKKAMAEHFASANVEIYKMTGDEEMPALVREAIEK